nr:MFS transporter [Romeria gracilis]
MPGAGNSVETIETIKALENTEPNSAPPPHRLGFWQLWNMSFGFFGIQVGWGLQMANTSAIFEYLGADAHQLPLLWLAAPLTGLVVQPVIGYLSDRTRSPLGRRRPYFLAGAILSSVALVLMPNASSLWMVAGLLWVLDTSINVSMTPFRSFVGDLLPEDQLTAGFSVQSLLQGLGAIAAAALPWVLTHGFHLAEADGNEVPFAVKLSFYIGAMAFLISVLWTVVSVREAPPAEPTEEQSSPGLGEGLNTMVREMGSALWHMPPVMRQLAWVQSFSWLGMFCMFLYFPPAIARNILGASSQGSALYAEGIAWAGLCIALYNAVCCIFAFALPHLVRAIGAKLTHTLCLIAGAVGLMSLGLIHDPYMVLLSMVGVGIAWASLLALPYALLIDALEPEQSCLYMGIFNLFIVLPEIIASLGLGWLMINVLDENRLTAVVIGGSFMLVAALLMQRVQPVESATETAEAVYQQSSVQ